MTALIPAAEIIAERVYGGLRTARILCPNPACGRTHLHRWTPGDTTTHVGPCGTNYTITTTERKPR